MLSAEQSGSTARTELLAAPRKHKLPEPEWVFPHLGALLYLSMFSVTACPPAIISPTSQNNLHETSGAIAK